ncbi:hypothetical protein [Paenibacillus gallinarum]|nr:hypothetical protein [Paenibacillus gallinarum]
MEELLLDILYSLVRTEQNRKLTEVENATYIKIADYFHANNIEIPFGIEM